MPIFDKPGRVVGADRNIARRVSHDVVDAGGPSQRGLRRQIPETGHGIADRVERGAGEYGASKQQRVDDALILGCAVPAINGRKIDVRLRAENGRGERIGGRDHREVFGRIGASARVGKKNAGTPSDPDSLGAHDLGAGRHRRVVVNRRQREPRLRRRCSKARIRAGRPETRPAFVRPRAVRHERKRRRDDRKAQRAGGPRGEPLARRAGQQPVGRGRTNRLPRCAGAAAARCLAARRASLRAPVQQADHERLAIGQRRSRLKLFYAAIIIGGFPATSARNRPGPVGDFPKC